MNDPFGSTTLPERADRPRPSWLEPETAPVGAPSPITDPVDPMAEPVAKPRAAGRGVRGVAGVALALVAGFTGGKLASSPAPVVAPAAGPAATVPQSSMPPAVSAGADLAALYRTLAPSVVQIISSGQGENGSGSGVVIDAAGTILTNNHVVGGDQVRVVLSDGRRLEATVAGRDPRWDLAVVRLADPPAGLVPARLGDSSKVVPGQSVVAIGAPFGLQGSLSSGVVSAINRTFAGGRGSPAMRGLIQTDAAINPGNSGGPLFNLAGEVIGITTAIESPIRGSVGVGFAVPINQAQTALPSLVRGEEVRHPFLGIEGDAAPGGGVNVLSISPGTSVDGSGLRAGDVITAIAGVRVNSLDELARALETHRVGDKVTLTVRRGGETLSITVTLRATQGG